ncbi:hypothetical protein U9M48_025202 [Paspalum notatum var. saurae]|uniref:Uncharacterized protein n=1 Tax=Paspalum notatum var. saurae TaxID=547442 RepID=A0AAQ3WY28_PASNO
MEEAWTIQEAAFNVSVLSTDCFIPPAADAVSIGERGGRGGACASPMATTAMASAATSLAFFAPGSVTAGRFPAPLGAAARCSSGPR